MAIQLPERLDVINVGFMMDGGSLLLRCRDDRGADRSVFFRRSLGSTPAGRRQYGLHLDGEVIERGSDAERRLGELLCRSAEEIQSRPADADPVDRRPAPVSERKNVLVLGDNIKAFMNGSPRENTLSAVRDVVEYIDTPHLDSTRT